MTSAGAKVLHCPVCKARNERGPHCRRCRADLELLFALEEQRGALLAEACRAAGQGHWRAARHAARAAEALRGGDDVLRVRAVCHLMERDFAAAWACFAAHAAAVPER